ncbi:hypothetical protein BDBG_17112 [Blastomyces gilchristii SLH14081]|uniref:Uncharacterized protein n=1 Tax=Blastomyces gilchristii (strain SLH14081) TaxID=559298 RepID=A0A179ULM1_BLAGS|nr:uncharacterized protein BDBG_17112 [Blastomyces gilchristii SLH14081]OAT08780.1 hypothetical protein BDBG_17112 [Blastomyces gilchristii SLH14081]
MREVEEELNTDESISRRDNTSLQGIVTVIMTAREAGGEEEEDVTMRAVLSQSVNTTVFTFNWAFLTVMKAAAAS